MKGCTLEMAQPTPERWLDLIDNVEDAFCRFKKVRCKFKMMKKSFFKVEEEDGNERVVEPQRTLPVHARCQVKMSNVKFHKSNVRCQMSNIKPRRTLPVHARCQVMLNINDNCAYRDAENCDAW